MNDQLNAYLGKIERGLRSLPVSERVDIVKEIKSEILELEAQGMTNAAIMERLGSPRELIMGYLGKSLEEHRRFSLRRFLLVASFYGYVGLGGLFLLPITSVAAAGFLLSGVISPLCGIVRLVSYLFGHDIPNLSFVMGDYVAGPVAYLPISFAVGAVAFAIGWLSWKLTLWFIRSVGRRKPGAA